MVIYFHILIRRYDMKKFVSLLLCAVMVFSLSAVAFADGGEVYKMEMEPDVKRIYDAEGNYALLASVRIFWQSSTA